jgi:hypothetical protein
MNKKILSICMAALLPGVSFAQGPHDYQCTFGDLQRRVVIFYETGVMVPCEVHYYKDTEAPGEHQVLWRAMNEAGYCERKTDEFIAKMKESGWDCGLISAAETEAQPVDDAPQDAEAGAVDDTEALQPSEGEAPTEDR